MPAYSILAGGGRSWSRFAVLLVLAASGAGAGAADFDLCVRGSTLERTHTLHLKLQVLGADVAAFAPRLGAALANRHFWNGTAQRISGAPFDADLCGDAVAEERSLSVTMTPEQAQALEAESTRGADSGMLQTLERMLGKDPAAAGEPVPDTGPARGEEIRDAHGRIAYHLMRVYYATDRNASAGAPDRHFGGDRGTLAYGVVNVTIPKLHQRGALEGPSILRLEFSADPAKHVVLQSLSALYADAWRAEISKRATGLDNPGILVFIHGYNSSFADAARRAAQLTYDINFSGATVLFSWPSRGELVDYTVDEQNAEWSVSDMKTVLASLATVAPGTPIYVIAHSMGNRVLTRGFKAMLDEDRSKRRAFSQVVLAAPDVDADVFRRDIAPSMLGRAGGPRVTLYASSNDKALMASRDLHGGYRRLGESGENLVLMPDLDTVDASDVRTEFLGHSYFGDSGTVLSDLVYLIHERLRPQERERFSLDPVKNLAIVYWRFKPHPLGQ
jgi:esterase/lipase superfamily enzyme